MIKNTNKQGHGYFWKVAALQSWYFVSDIDFQVIDLIDLEADEISN